MRLNARNCPEDCRASGRVEDTRRSVLTVAVISVHAAARWLDILYKYAPHVPASTYPPKSLAQRGAMREEIVIKVPMKNIPSSEYISTAGARNNLFTNTIIHVNLTDFLSLI